MSPGGRLLNCVLRIHQHTESERARERKEGRMRWGWVGWWTECRHVFVEEGKKASTTLSLNQSMKCCWECFSVLFFIYIYWLRRKWLKHVTTMMYCWCVIIMILLFLEIFNKSNLSLTHSPTLPPHRCRRRRRHAANSLSVHVSHVSIFPYRFCDFLSLTHSLLLPLLYLVSI